MRASQSGSGAPSLVNLFTATSANGSKSEELGPLVRQVAQLHRFHDAVHDQGGSQSGSQSQKEQLAVFVASERLHGRIVQHLDRAFEGGFEIETGPTLSQIPGFRNGPVFGAQVRGVTDGDNIVFPVSNEFPNFRGLSALASGSVRKQTPVRCPGRWQGP